MKAEERMQTWNGKLGLLNASDYFYASKDSDCLTKPLTNWNCKNDNWIPYNYAGGVWTINPSSQSTDSMGYIYYMQHVGCIDHQQGHVTAVYLMVTHLKEDIQIISGDGSQETPYIIAA